MKVILVRKASGKNFSIEAGLADGERNFDHHDVYEDEPCPSIDERIPIVGDNDVVEITHMDADVLLGLRRMAGMELPHLVNLHLVELLDKDAKDFYPCPTIFYIIGVKNKSAELSFPEANEEGESQDVTEKVLSLLEIPSEDLVLLGCGKVMIKAILSREIALNLLGSILETSSEKEISNDVLNLLKEIQETIQKMFD